VFRVVAAVAAFTTMVGACVGGGVGPKGGGSHPTSAPAPRIAGCQVFPANNAWNENVSALPVRSDSSKLVASIDKSRQFLHADFGTDPSYGIPFLVVPSTEASHAVHYTAYGDESDPGPFPIPANAPVEGGASSGGDRHVLVLQQGSCRVFELYRAFWKTDHWNADSGATWKLSSNALRPLGWTSADAAGLPILPGLARVDEVLSGHIDHALRFTVDATQAGYILPATHDASSSKNAALPPMGLRLRLKKSFDLSHYHGQALVILKALQQYGMIVADNGSSWFISGASDPRWNDTDLDQLKTVPGSAFEAVNTGPVRH
jgi:hypothetical protein